MSQRKRNLGPIIRAISVLSAVSVITAGITFAALQSSTTALTDNTIETATANLQVSTDGSHYSDSLPGFDFNNVLPGDTTGVPTNGYSIYLKNQGSVGLLPGVMLKSLPETSGTVDLSKVYLKVTPYDGMNQLAPQLFSLKSLTQPGGQQISGYNLYAGSGRHYLLQVTMDSDAFTGSGVTISKFDIVFTGALTTNN